MDSRSRKIVVVLSGLLVLALALILALLLRSGNDQTGAVTTTVVSTVTAEAPHAVTDAATNPETDSNTKTQALAADQASQPAESSSLPTKVGECSVTTITSIGSRLVGMPNSGTEVGYANGGGQVDYFVAASVQDWKVGDKVRLCLMSVPANCPPGDNRGKVYKATNLRTGETWEAPDSEHKCGGA